MKWLGATVLAALVSRSAAGAAEPPPVLGGADAPVEVPVGDAVEVAGDDGCIERGALVAHVASWLGRDRVDGRLRVRVLPGKRGVRSAGFTLLRDGAAVAERQFDFIQSACPDRRAALALAIALALDAAVLDSLGLRPEPPDAPRRAAAAEPAPRPARVPDRMSLDVAAHGAVLEHVLPRPIAAGSFTVETGRQAFPVGGFADSWRVRLGVLGTGAADTHLGPGAFRAALVAGRVDACLARRRQFVSVQGCVGAAAGPVMATGRGYDRAHEAAVWWVAAAGRVGVRIALGSMIAVEVAATGLVPFVRPRMVVEDDAGRVLQERALPVAGGGIEGGLVLRLR